MVHHASEFILPVEGNPYAARIIIGAPHAPIPDTGSTLALSGLGVVGHGIKRKCPIL